MKIPEQFRVVDGESGSNNNGTFIIPSYSGKMMLVIVRDNSQEEKLKISIGGSTPGWRDLCKLIMMFWGEEERKVEDFTILQGKSVTGIYRAKKNIRCEPIFDDDHGFNVKLNQEDNE
jgi:hypothetical protein